MLVLVTILTLIFAGVGILLSQMSAPPDRGAPIWVTPLPHPGPTP